MNWSIQYFSLSVQNEIVQLPPALQARFIHLSQRMLVYGADLGMPHTRALGDGLYELRLKGVQGIARVFYCVLIGKRIVFLHAFTKKTEKTPHKELETARRRLKELRNADS
jgi:phage-related protein